MTYSLEELKKTFENHHESFTDQRVTFFKDHPEITPNEDDFSIAEALAFICKEIIFLQEKCGFIENEMD
jgi:hypothetical protein